MGLQPVALWGGGAVFCLSACVGTADMVSAPPPSPVLTAIAALPRTALMPNGAASYRGSYTVVENSMETTGNQTHRWSETSTAQLVLNANFATRSVTAGLSNLVIRSEFETSAGLGVDHNYTEFSGQSTGSGPITTTGGVVGFQANLTGTFTARRVGTSASDAVSAVGDAIFSIDDPITLSGDFRGPQAEAILGVQSLDLGMGSKITTIIASRPLGAHAKFYFCDLPFAFVCPPRPSTGLANRHVVIIRALAPVCAHDRPP